MSGTPSPERFFGELVPRQFNRALEEQAAREGDGRRVYEAMRGVDATIRVEVTGEGGGIWFLNIRAGEMSAGSRPARPPFLTFLQGRPAFERIAREANDSVFALLGGLAGVAGGMRLTRARIESLLEVDGLISFEVMGGEGFSLLTHFGGGPVPDEPKARITVDEDAYRELCSGTLDPQSAFMNERIRVEGDMQAAMQLALAAIAPD